VRLSACSTYRPSRPLTTSESGEAGLTDRVISSGLPLALSRSVLDHGLCPVRLDDGPDAILLVVCQECPDNSSVFIGQCDGRAVLAASGDERFEPPTPVITLRADPAERGSRAVHEEFTPRAIPAFTNPEEPWRAARRVFPRN
jgi:hypothetical protein